jgi:hypothetical protein
LREKVLFELFDNINVVITSSPSCNNHTIGDHGRHS